MQGKKNITLIAILLVVVLVIVGFRVFSQRNGDFPSARPPVGTNDATAFDFTLESHDGTLVSLSDFDGKVRVVNSWATWCPFCVDELPDFARLQQEFIDDIVVIAVNRSESGNRSQSYVEDLDITGDMVFLLDPRDTFYASIGGFSMPETIFIDASGEIVSHRRGPLSLEEMRSVITGILESQNS